ERRPTTRFTVFFFQAEDGIRDWSVTGVQTCALPIWPRPTGCRRRSALAKNPSYSSPIALSDDDSLLVVANPLDGSISVFNVAAEIGRASCRERVEIWGVGGEVKKQKREEKEGRNECR